MYSRGTLIRFELAGVRVKRVNLHENKYQGEWQLGSSLQGFELSGVRVNGIILNTYSMKTPMLYYILNMKMTSQSLSRFCIELRAEGEWFCEV